MTVSARVTSYEDRPMLTYRPKLGRNDRVVRLTVSVPVEVDASAWELSYGIEPDEAALVADVRGRVRATVEDAVRAAFTLVDNGSTIR